MVRAATVTSCGQSVNCMNALRGGGGDRASELFLQRPHLGHTCAGASKNSGEDKVSKGGLSGIGHSMGL